MAIRDLLWACPVCGREGGLATARRGEVCTDCGTLYRRGRRATIQATLPDGTSETLHAAEWARRLPPLDLAARVRADENGNSVLHQEPVLARFAERLEPLHHRGTYLNRIERFGPYREGVLTLETTRLRLEHDGKSVVWPFEKVRAVQPSSSTLQLSAKGAALVSFRFPNGSARYWEEIIAEALRGFYRDNGLGEILEFQPRIVTR